MTTIDEVKRATSGKVPELVRLWLPEGSSSNGNWCARNPTRDDRHPSFSVSLETGAFCDFATSDKGGDIVALRAYLDRSDQVAAARKIADELGVSLPTKPNPGRPALEVIMPIPDDAPPLPESFGRMGKPSRVWCYRDAEGRPLFHQARFEVEGGKEFRPISFCRVGNGDRFEWRLEGPPAPRPLYGLDRLKAASPEDTILVVEGEKAADAATGLLAEHGYIAVSPMNGAQSPRKSDWSPVEGRDVRIWPDNDEAGRDFAAKVARLASAAGALSVSVVKLPTGLPPKWDLADELPDDLDPAAIADAAATYAPDIGDEISRAGGDFQDPFVLLRRAAVLDGVERKPGVYWREEKEDKAPELIRRGTLEGWRTEVAALCVGNDRLILAVCVALAGPALHIIGEPTGGFHLRGPSSIGKSKALAVASSVCGCGEQVDTWRKTDNALEGVAYRANDGLLVLDEIGEGDARAVSAAVYMLVLDEIGEGDARAVSAAVYMLANGRGKARMTKAGGVRDPYTWRLSFISSGEIGIAEKLAEAGLRAKAGQHIRCIDIEADAGGGMGLFQDLHGEINGDRFARRIDAAVSEEQGTALRVWVEQIANDMNAKRQRILDARERFITALELPDGVDGQIHRAASRFAVMAAVGETASEITGWPEGTAFEAMAALLRGWIQHRGTERHEEKEAVETVRLYIEKYGDARFTDPWSDEANQKAEEESAARFDRKPRHTPKARAFQRAGFTKINEHGTADYLILPDVWRTEVCEGLDPVLVAKTLKREGFLETDPDGRNTRKVRVPGITTQSRVY